MKKETEAWLNVAKEDYADMQVMMQAKRYRGAVFFAQQAVEKILKGYIAEYTNTVPKKTHFIEILIKDAKLELAEIDNPNVAILSSAYAWVRYSDLSNEHFKTKKNNKKKY
ncbi:HEPN domain-containing protein [Candidatus Roizmanbacteria bacterium]|nr:HEPN domain-containing protein [Candidatus Roizmanbacteria bacterium]